jgi:hypothetical protein
VFSESSLSRTKITIAATGEALYLRGMSDVPKGPRTVLYNPAARATFLGLGVSDDRIIVSMNRDLGREAMFTTAGTLGCMSAAWLLLTRKRERKTRS